MQDLTLVGLSEDRKTLLLTSASGERYSLPIDEKLRAALRGDYARLGQLEIQMDSALRPRDIQARIRAGESPETVAQAAQSTVERIMRYASPVLAERAHIAERAQRASVRRKTADGQARLLGEVAAEQLRAENVDPETVDWDAWRREDGRWTLVADYRLTEQAKRARFIFDVQGRYVVADDEDALWLVGEQPAAAPKPPRQERQPRASGRRLAAVPVEQELPLGDDAIELVSPGEESTVSPHEKTVDLTETAWQIRTPAPTGDADWIATQASERPTAPERAGERQQEQAQPAEESPAEQTEPAEPTAKREEKDVATEASRPAPKKSGRKGRRASVPSWDEIMFGGGRPD